MANTEIFLRNIFGTTRPNIRPLVLALNITNDLLFEQHISMSDIKATKHIYPDVARLLHKKPETVYKSVIRLAHRCWDALVEQDLVLSYLGRSMKQEPDPSVFITYLAVYIQSDIPFFEFIERDPGFLFRDSPDIFGMSDIPPESTTKLLLRNKPLLVSQAMAFTSPAGLTTFPVCPACMAVWPLWNVKARTFVTIADNAWIGVGTSTPRSSTPGKNQHSIFLTRMMF